MIAYIWTALALHCFVFIASCVSFSLAEPWPRTKQVTAVTEALGLVLNVGFAMWEVYLLCSRG